MPKSELAKLEAKLLHYVEKAIIKFNMLKDEDKVLVCLSGGKDSFTLLYLLNKLRQKHRFNFKLHSFTLDQSHPGWDDSELKTYLEGVGIPFTIETKDTYSVVKSLIPEGNTYCSLCSRLRRGNIYRFAKENGFSTIALGHHRDDLIQTLLMSIFYNGSIRSMPPKLLTDDGQHLVIRPLVYCQEADIKKYAELKQFPLIPCNLCGSLKNSARRETAKLIKNLATSNPKIPSNILHALTKVHPTQLMDSKLFNFMNLQSGAKADALLEP